MWLYRLFGKSDCGTIVTPKTGVTLLPQTVSTGQLVPGTPVVYHVNLDAGAIGNTDKVITNKFRVTGAYFILRTAGVLNTTIQVFNGSNAITEAMAAGGSDTAVVQAAVLNDANFEIAAGGTLRVTTATGATQPGALVVVEGVLV